MAEQKLVCVYHIEFDQNQSVVWVFTCPQISWCLGFYLGAYRWTTIMKHC
jgi:hypothetical protein